MANPSNVFRVEADVTPVELSSQTGTLVTTAQTYYPNEMLGFDSSEKLTKFDDAASLRFAGIFDSQTRLTITASSSTDELKVQFKKPRYITMYIAAATAGTDERKPVYAAYSNQVAFTTGTYGNYVGKCNRVIDSTHIEIDTLASEQECDNTALTLAATGNDTLTRNHINRTIIVPNTAAKTLTLPAVAKVPIGAWMLFIKTTADAYSFTLDGNSSETINGQLTYVSAAIQYDSVKIVSDGSAWHIQGGSGLVLGGTSRQTISNTDGSTALVPNTQLLGTDKATGSLLIASFNTTNDTTVSAALNFLKGGSGTIGGTTIVASGETLGEINFFGCDGVDYKSCAASIQCLVDTTPGAGDMPGRLAFFVSADGGETLAEAMRIANSKLVTMFGSFAQGADSTDRVTIKGIYMSPANVAVAVPSITDPDCARVQVDVSSAFSIQPAVGDFVIAAPQEALPTNSRLGGAWVYQTDGIEITFSSEAGNVTGASKNFKFLVIDVT